MDSIEPVVGDEEEELDDQELDDEQEIPEAVEPEGEQEEMPEDLLSPTELAERNEQRASRKPIAAEREPEDRSAVVAELRDLFQEIRQQPVAREEERRPAPEFQPFTLSEEQAKRISTKALEEEGGIAKLIAASVNIGEKRALARMAASPEGQAAMESSGRLFANDFISDKLDDPKTKFSKAVKPQFQAILKGYNMSELASMSKADRDAWFEETWERATGRALLNKSVTKTAPSPGVARGAGARPGAPARGRVVIRMTDAQKKDLRASAPRLFSGEEGEKRFRRQVWEIEHGMTDNPNVRAMTRQSVQFGEAVGFGG
jgi:hypothetical protein